MNMEKPKRHIATEGFASPERPLPETGCLIVLGGGINKVQIEGDDEPRWKVARYIMPRRKGAMVREDVRGPFRKDEKLDDPEAFFAAGGNAHLIGTIEYLEEMRARGKMPKHIIMSGGLSKSTTGEAPDFNEGRIFEAALKRRLPDVPGIESRGQGSSNTEGDLINGLSAANEYGMTEVIILLTDIRMERTKLMYEKVRQEHPELAGIQASFISAEELLSRRYSKDPKLSAKFKNILETLHGSAMGKRIKEMEQEGVRKLKEGGYKPLGH